MNIPTMIVALVFMVLVAAILILQQVKSLVTRKNQSSEQEKQLKAQLAILEQRVQTLERIATDKSSQLKDKIDAL